MKHRSSLVALLGLAGFLAACGNNPQERTTGGAAAGAATGAAVGALAGPPGHWRCDQAKPGQPREAAVDQPRYTRADT